MSRFDGKRAVITGGTGGAGRAVVLRLAEGGVECHVPYMTDRHRDALTEAASARGLTIHPERLDITDATAVERFYTEVVDRAGPLHFLVNLAGGFDMGSIEETGPDTWRRLLDMNATSAFLNCRQAAMRMKPRRYGRIVSVSANSVLQTPARMTAYVAAKAAVLALTQSLAHELEPHRVTVNAILPSIIDTPANRASMPNADRSTWVTADQLADAVELLLADRASGITGAALPLTAPP